MCIRSISPKLSKIALFALLQRNEDRQRVKRVRTTGGKRSDANANREAIRKHCEYMRKIDKKEMVKVFTKQTEAKEIIFGYDYTKR